MSDRLLAQLAALGPLPLDQRVERVLATTAQELGAAIAAIWRYNPSSGFCSCFSRFGYVADASAQALFVLPYEGSFIAQLIVELTDRTLDNVTVDLTNPSVAARHWAPSVLRDQHLEQLIAIPFYNLALPTIPLRTDIRGVVLYYFRQPIILPSSLAPFLSSVFSDLYSSLYLKKKDEATDRVMDVFVQQSPNQTPTSLLEDVCKTVCVETLRVEACSIYEWSAIHSGYRLSATTGISASSEKVVIDRRGDGLISAIAAKSASVLLDHIHDRDHVEAKLGNQIDPKILFRNAETTASPYTAAMFIPVLNPVASRDRFPTAIIKFVNKRHRLTELVDFFDIEDQLLGEEIARMVALYEEQARALRQLEAFALQFGHEAQAPAVGIRGTADRILYRISKGSVEDGLVAAMAQDIFDFAEIMISFAESLNFGFGDRRLSRQLRYKFRQTNLTRCIESARKVVIPICREEGIQFDNIRVFGTFPILYIDSRAFMQVFYNLMTNAIKYRLKDRPLEFGIQLSSRFVEDPHDLTEREDLMLHRIWQHMAEAGYIRRGVHVIDCSDFGVGVLEEEMIKVFWEGFRSPRVSAQEIRGSGVGLTIVRNILADFDSLIWVESRQEPTTFRIMIPDLVESSNYTRKDRARSWRHG